MFNDEGHVANGTKVNSHGWILFVLAFVVLTCSATLFLVLKKKKAVSHE